ncbi:annexin D4-like isoform X1 [Durio zibethinus]|uniref:Annexin D4-like isoform X1 n=1 Tax=Durio zibethinus TaxID=66656 RepID=A0A6P5Z4Z0_DURZI|nr:annexin D4-like isoform X1 [Durio zibethinus]
MAYPDHLEALNKAFSGIGVDENSLISIVANSNHEHKKSFRKGCSKLFIEDQNGFERMDQSIIKNLKLEFKRFRDAVVLSLLHPWERDARLIEKAMKKGQKHYDVIVEIACTRSSNELLGARKAYHSLFHHSVEEHLATHVKGCERKLLVALVSAYRYEGPKVNEDVVKSEAEILSNAIKNADKRKPIEDEDTIMILATRSKPHLKAVYEHYNKICDKSLTEDLEAEGILKDTVECLCTPETYFTRILDAGLSVDGDEESKRAVTRVIVTQREALVKEGYAPNKIQGILTGHYKDFILGSLAREEMNKPL